MTYIVFFGPEEADEYTAHKAVEEADGSLSYFDTAGIPHKAKPGEWRKEEFDKSKLTKTQT